MSESAEKAVVFSSGDAQLVAVVHAAPNPEAVGVVIVVGGPQYRVGSHRQFTIMARGLAQRGYDVLRFDYRGMGDSDGSYSGFEHCSQEIRAAIDLFILQRPHLSRIVLFGLCDGASAALMYAVQDSRVTGLLLANPWVRSEKTEAATFVRHYYWRRIVQPSFWMKLLKGGVQIRKSVADLNTNIQRAGASTAGPAESFIVHMRKALLAFAGRTMFLISGNDLTAREFVDVFEKDAEWEPSRRNRRILRKDLPQADHTFSERASLDQSIEHCAAWLRANA